VQQLPLVICRLQSNQSPENKSLNLMLEWLRSGAIFFSRDQLPP